MLQADIVVLERLSFNLSWRWIDRVGSYENFPGGKSTGEILSYRPYSLADAKASWNGGKWSLYLEADNLFDTKYFDHGNIPQPGIWIKLGTIVRL